MIILICFAIVVLIIGYVLLWYFQKEKKNFGSLAGKRIYADTEKRPGFTLVAQSIPLVGKPDYLLKEGTMIIPVEVKTGRTPEVPHSYHKMQLFAYCYLVEEYFSVTPMHGIIKYPEKEFHVPYTEHEKEAVKAIVLEILACKKSGKEQFCNHRSHNTTVA